MPLIEWNWPNSNRQRNEEPETNIEQLISNVSINSMQVIIADDYVHIDHDIQTEEITMDEEAIIEEILQLPDSDSDRDSGIEIEKIPHSVTLEQCKSLLQYVEQQDPENFVEEQDLPRLQSLL